MDANDFLCSTALGFVVIAVDTTKSHCPLRASHTPYVKGDTRYRKMKSSGLPTFHCRALPRLVLIETL